MQKTLFSQQSRENRLIELTTDTVIAGGGLAGVCAAIAAARAGSKVILVQDRPVLGGNASSEVRLWALGATSHMGNNNRWSREGGIIDEIMLDNLRRNKEGNPIVFDTVLLDKVVQEPNITLLLNTAVYQVNKKSDTKIESLDAFCSQNSIHYQLKANYFIDATGDGLVAFNAGASFRIGGESQAEFGEKLAPEKESTELLGHTIFFYSKSADQPVEYIAPSYAHLDVENTIPRSKIMSETDAGCRLWWIEYGGIRDTIYETEDIKWELWRIVYGLWNYIKNSGKFEGVENLTLEWVGTVPGKRESRRFEGEYMIKQQDIVEQRQFEDAISFGGWAIDIHPAEGVYSDQPACSQWHSKGVYQIPYRCFLSKDIENLFFAGRNISATHMAFGSTRVMITCAHGGQAVGTAAAMCQELNVQPKALLEKTKMKTLQQRLNQFAHGIPNIPLDTQGSLIDQAKISPSSTLALSEIPFNGDWLSLDMAAAQMLPLLEGPANKFKVQVKAQSQTQLTCELRVSGKAYNYTPEVSLKTLSFDIASGEQIIEIDLSNVTTANQYAFLIFHANDEISIKTSQSRITGLLSVFNKVHKAVSNNGKQEMDPAFGIDSFEFWTPQRRPKGHNIAMSIEPALACYSAEQLKNGYMRPWLKSNAWVAKPSDKTPHIKLNWSELKTIKGIKLYFDTDADHALETVWMPHQDKIMPCCVQNYLIKNKTGEVLYRQTENYQTVNHIQFDQPIETDELIIELEHPSENSPAALFEIDVF